MTLTGIDLETASAADLKSCGAWAYSLHPSTRVYCAVFGRLRPDGTVETRSWEPGQPVPRIAASDTMLAHNCAFEKAIWQNVLTPRYGWPVMPAAWEDTQAHAAAANLPVTLEGLGKALGAPVQKDTEGHALMKQMCWLDPVMRDGVLHYENPNDTPANRARLLAYCETDVVSMLAIWLRVPRMIVREKRVWELDQRINTRGLYLDREFVKRMQAMVQIRKRQLVGEAIDVSDGGLQNATNSSALKNWLKSKDITLPIVKRLGVGGATESESIGRNVVVELAAAVETDPAVKLVLENRLEASKATSLAKLNKVEQLVDPRDGRLRNSLQFCAAHTGRWSSRGLQIHNLARGKKGSTDEEKARLKLAFAAALRGDLDGLLASGCRPLEVLSWSLRSMIAAAPGCEILGADFSAIEARVLAWLAGQQDVLDILADPARDIYVEDAKGAGSSNRQLGKVLRLGLGYGMGPIKFASTARLDPYRVTLSLKEARRLVLGWRKLNPAIVQLWRDVEDGCRNAMQAPGTVFPMGSFLKAAATDTCLLVQLPSGRAIRYWRPSVRSVVKKVETVDEDGEIITIERESSEIRFYTSSPNAVDMDAESTYGGKLVENVTQAVARDLLADALIRLDPTYPVVVHVHDSIASEVPEGTGSVEEFCSIMAQVPTWAPGLPLRAEGYRDRRFRG